MGALTTPTEEHPALIPVAFMLQGRTDFLVRKTKSGKWQLQGELIADFCCPVAASNHFLKHKGRCVCPDGSNT